MRQYARCYTLPLRCLFLFTFFFFKQKTAYEMRISDWSSDVCSSDLDAAKALRDGIVDHAVDLRARRHPHDEGERPGDRGVVGEGDHRHLGEIGRASCRERVCQYV